MRYDFSKKKIDFKDKVFTLGQISITETRPQTGTKNRIEGYSTSKDNPKMWNKIRLRSRFVENRV